MPDIPLKVTGQSSQLHGSQRVGLGVGSTNVCGATGAKRFFFPDRLMSTATHPALHRLLCSIVVYKTASLTKLPKFVQYYCYLSKWLFNFIHSFDLPNAGIF